MSTGETLCASLDVIVIVVINIVTLIYAWDAFFQQANFYKLLADVSYERTLVFLALKANSDLMLSITEMRENPEIDLGFTICGHG